MGVFKNKRGDVRSGWIIAGVTLTALLLTFILAANIGGAIILLHVAKTGSTNFSEIIRQTEGTITIVSAWVQQAIFILIPIITWKFLMKRPLTNMGLKSLKNYGKDLIAGLLFGIASISTAFAILLLSGQAVVTSWSPHLSSDIITYLLLFIAVGFSEEIYGRGFVMATLRRTKSVLAAIFVSAAIFALLHIANPGMGIVPFINIFLIGVLFAYMYLLSGNIWMCIGYHITWNYFQGNIYGFLVSGNSSRSLLTTVIEKDTIINGGAFGPEGGLVVTCVILAGIMFVKYYYKRRSYSYIRDTLAQ